MKRIPAFLLAFLILAACKSRPVPPKVEVGAAIAQVGEKVILDRDLLNAVDVIKKKFPREFATHPEKKSLLEQMINVELLADAAKAAGLDKEFEFKTRLADLYVQRLSEEIRAKVSDKELIKYHRENAGVIDQISARHILLRTDSTKKETQRKKLQEILAEAKANPESFSELATKHSDDKSGQRGGDLGFFSYGMMIEPFSKAAFALKNIGDISPIIETDYGFHIIQLSEDRRGFEKNRAVVTDRYMRSVQRKIFDEEIKKLRAQNKIQIFEEALLKSSPLPEIINKDPDETLQYQPPTR